MYMKWKSANIKTLLFMFYIFILVEIALQIGKIATPSKKW